MGVVESEKKKVVTEKNGVDSAKESPILNPHVVEEPWDENQEKMLLLNKMRLHIDSGVHTVHQDFLREPELQEIAKRIELPQRVHKIRDVIVAPEDEELPEGWEKKRIEEFRKKIHEHFDGTALREEIIPDPL